MEYASNGSGYACSNRSGDGYASAGGSVSDSYLRRMPRRRLRFLGCTCGGHGPCRATCRTPVPE